MMLHRSDTCTASSFDIENAIARRASRRLRTKMCRLCQHCSKTVLLVVVIVCSWCVADWLDTWDMMLHRWDGCTSSSFDNKNDGALASRRTLHKDVPAMQALIENCTIDCRYSSLLVFCRLVGHMRQQHITSLGWVYINIFCYRECQLVGLAQALHEDVPAFPTLHENCRMACLYSSFPVSCRLVGHRRHNTQSLGWMYSSIF
jgi:hypothetical protein